MILLGESVLKLEVCFFDVAIHGSFESAMRIVPGKVDTYVPVAFPVQLHGVVVLECFFEVEGVSFVEKFDPEAINDESERDGSGLVEVETRGVLGGVVITSGEDFSSCLLASLSACLRP